MGTMLQQSGLQLGEIPEILNITQPQLICDIHKKYVNAGADIVYANTFGANSYKLKNSGYSVEEIISAAVNNAKDAVKGTNALTALDIGPIGQLLEPAGALSFDDAYNIFKQQILAGCCCDVIVFETMTDLYELKAAVLAAKENSNKPIICTMTFEQNGRTFTGVSPSAMAITLDGLGVDAIGVNCSLGPNEFAPVIKEIAHYTALPIVAKPNAGLPDPNSSTYDISPTEFAKQLCGLIPYGVKIMGGCCGTTPEYIKNIVNEVKNKASVTNKPNVDTTLCSGVTSVTVDQPRIIGERINPTGKKLFKQALINNDMDYILSQAISQVKGGADILDVNVGLPEIDEKQMMIKAVKAIQSVVDVPLQIDTTNSDVLEAGLRYYNGKPIVNSVNGEEKSLSTVLPLVKKYGAAVVGLTLDEKGIPKTALDRFEIAKKIVERAKSYGISPKDVYIDCLTLTASAQQEGVIETLKAMRMVKEQLGCKTVLGVSNISFGLPNRELVNSTFLTMALESGLDLPIINPNIEAMTDAIRAYKVLANIDKNSVDFIAYSNTHNTQATVQQSKKSENIDLGYAIENGLKTEGAKITQELLLTVPPLDVVNNHLIPALDKAGAQFEKGITFLPQLIQSAAVAQACFEVIKQKLVKENNSPVSKGKIILATVKGDIHDIGKNIVKVLLDNYGYTVIDLGKDVDPELIVNTAIEQNVTLVGLSALMTTTLKSMENTINLIHNSPKLNETDENGNIIEKTCKCITFVGGAVLTPEYANKIGADYYCRDAKESVDVAKRIFK